MVDIALAVVNTAWVLEHNSEFLNDHLTLIKLFLSVGSSYYLLINWQHWLFACEYLQVSFAIGNDGAEMTE